MLVKVTESEFEMLAAVRFLDGFKAGIDITANDKTLEIPKGKTVSAALIALAAALKENGVIPHES